MIRRRHGLGAGIDEEEALRRRRHLREVGINEDEA